MVAGLMKEYGPYDALVVPQAEAFAHIVEDRSILRPPQRPEASYVKVRGRVSIEQQVRVAPCECLPDLMGRSSRG